jgi:hypothetical protein
MAKGGVAGALAVPEHAVRGAGREPERVCVFR